MLRRVGATKQHQKIPATTVTTQKTNTMVFRRIFRGKRKGQFRSKKHDGTRTADACCDASNSFDACDVSSLGNSVYLDANGGTSAGLRRGIVETVLTKEDSFHQHNQMSHSQTTPKVIYMFPSTWKDQTASFCLDDNKNDLPADDASIVRRRKIFEEDYDDDDLAWDTAVVVDEDRYRRNRPPSWMTTSLSCLACV